MADVTDATQVRFCNEAIRGVANRLAQTYFACKELEKLWYANPLTLGTIPNDGTADIVDGSATDGRLPIHGDNVYHIINRASEFVADLEANSGAKLNTILAVATYHELR